MNKKIARNVIIAGALTALVVVAVRNIDWSEVGGTIKPEPQLSALEAIQVEKDAWAEKLKLEADILAAEKETLEAQLAELNASIEEYEVEISGLVPVVEVIDVVEEEEEEEEEVESFQ